MSIFAKKSDPEQRFMGDMGVTTTAGAGAPAANGPGRPYGIAEAIQLMRSLPIDQNTDLIVRVVRTTLASLNVHLPDIIEDASRKQKVTQERIAGVHSQIADLEKQLEVHRKEIAALEADLKETTSVKERLQMAEKSAGGGHGSPLRVESTPTPPFGLHATPPTPAGARPAPKPPEPPAETASHKD